MWNMLYKLKGSYKAEKDTSMKEEETLTTGKWTNSVIYTDVYLVCMRKQWWLTGSMDSLRKIMSQELHLFLTGLKAG